MMEEKMKRLKKLLPALIAIMMAFALAFAVACSGSCKSCGGGEDPAGDDSTTLTEITLNTDAAKTEYYIGDVFTSAGLVVTATYTKPDSTTESKAIPLISAKIDSSAYNSEAPGVYAISVSFTDGGVTKTASYNVTVTGISLKYDITNAQTYFLLGEDFSAEGLAVSLVSNLPDGTTETKTLTKDAATNGYTIDSSAYDKEVEGEYTIGVNYTNGVGSASASYKVTVNAPKAGLEVKYKTNVSDTFELDETHQKASIDAGSLIEVRKTDDYGNPTGDPLDPSLYTVGLYKGQTAVSDPTQVERGAYNIWVELKDEANEYEGYKLTGFALYYVIDNPVELTFNQSGATLEQYAIEDEITNTWSFKVKYSTGRTVDNVKFSDEGISADPKVDTLVAGSHSTTVSYSEKNDKGEDIKVSIANPIEYTINPRPTPKGQVTYTLRYYINEAGKWTTEWKSDVDAGNPNHDALQRDYDDNVKLAVKKSATEFDSTTKSESKSYNDSGHPENNRNFKYYAEFKYSRYGEIVVGAKAQNVNVVFYAWQSSSNSAKRMAYLGTALPKKEADFAQAGLIDNGNDFPSDKVLAHTEFSTGDAQRISHDLDSAGTYYVSANKTFKVAEISVTYTIDYDAAQSGSQTVVYQVASDGQAEPTYSFAKSGTDTDKITVTPPTTMAGSDNGNVAIADSDEKLTYAVEIKSSSDKKLGISVSSDLASASIKIYVKNHGGDTRTLTIANNDTSKGTDAKSLKLGTLDPADPTIIDKSKIQILAFDLTPGESYTVSATNTIKLYKIEITYSAKAAQD